VSGRTRDDDGIGVELTTCSTDDITTIARATNLFDAPIGVDRHPTGANELLRRSDERRHATARSCEHRATLATCVQHSARFVHQAVSGRDEFVELRHRMHAEVVGVGRIDAADERIDDAFQYLVSAARSNGLTQRRIGSPDASWQEPLERGAQFPSWRIDRSRPYRSPRGGYSEHGVRGNVVEFVVPDVSLTSGGMDEVVAETDERSENASADSSTDGTESKGEAEMTPPSRAFRSTSVVVTLG
jgi:hypothetical protein